MMKAVLFDIDGTLVRVGGGGREALARAMAEHLGVSLAAAREAAAQTDFRGRTDAVLFERIAARLGHTVRGLEPALTAAYLRALRVTLADAGQQARLQLMPGVAALLDILEGSSQVVVGLLTGNVRMGAELKLEAFGLGWLTQRPGGFGDDARQRRDIAAVARRRLAEVGVHRDADVVVVGDTERDVACARAIGARAVAVATGWTSEEELAGSQPDLCLLNLADPQPLIHLVGLGPAKE